MGVAIITAGNRIPYLRDLLSGLAGAGLHSFDCTIYLDGNTHYQAVSQLADAFNVSLSVRASPPAPKDARGLWIHVSGMYEWVFDAVFAPDAPHAFTAFFEDDLLVSPDVLDYFAVSTWLLDRDPTLYCASAHVDNAWLATAQDEGRLFRAGHFGAPGWVMSRNVFRQSILPVWQTLAPGKSPRSFPHWDHLFSSRIGTRECLFPEVARIHHRGAQGVSIKQEWQRVDYDNLRLSQSQHVDFGPLDSFLEGNYERHMELALTSAMTIHCTDEVLLHKHAVLVLPFQAEGVHDKAWDEVIRGTWGLWGLGHARVPRAIHRGSVALRLHTNLVHLVASYSPYARLPQLAPSFNFGDYSRPVCHASRTPEPVFDSSSVSFLADPQQSCTSACAEKKMACDEAFLMLVNRCKWLGRHRPCQSQGDQFYQPSCSSTQCTTTSTRFLNCAALPPLGERRACLCV